MGNLLCSDDNRVQGDHEEGAQNNLEAPKEVDVSSPRSVHSGDEDEKKKEEEKNLEKDKIEDKEEKKEEKEEEDKEEEGKEEEEDKEDKKKEDKKKKETKPEKKETKPEKKETKPEGKETKPEGKVSKLEECEFHPCRRAGRSDGMTQFEINNKHEIIITNKDVDSYLIQCYLGYQQANGENLVIRLRLNNVADANPKFSLGLMEEEKAPYQSVSKEGLNYEDGSFFEEPGNIVKVIKGKEPTWAKDAKKVGSKELEIRINLEKQILKVGSYPKYENVVEINKKESINPYGEYYFVVQIGNKEDSITVFDVFTVDKFDNLM